MFTPLLNNLRHQLVKNAPNVLALPSSLLPFFIQKKILGELLARLFKEAIEDGDLEFLEDKWLKVEVTDLKLVWFLSFCDEQLIIKEQSEQVDVTFSGDVNELILIAGRKEDPDTLFFQRRLSIQGDTELGLEVKNLLDNIDYDNLPDIAQQAIDRFSGFIQQGMQAPIKTV
ncbi:MAG: SCP2 domain-containing protein [Psychromonas sp.]|nr:SCP2 domain-containing protein [Alteromonadales bacterium]MCP5077208.1 SCP2 domain-containing protein [Psychromonas sp.]